MGNCHFLRMVSWKVWKKSVKIVVVKTMLDTLREILHTFSAWFLLLLNSQYCSNTITTIWGFLATPHPLKSPNVLVESCCLFRFITEVCQHGFLSHWNSMRLCTEFSERHIWFMKKNWLNEHNSLCSVVLKLHNPNDSNSNTNHPPTLKWIDIYFYTKKLHCHLQFFLRK